MSGTAKWTDTRLKDLFISVRNGVWGEDPDEETDTFCARGTDFDRATARVSSSKMPQRKLPVSTLRDHQLKIGDLVLEKSGGSSDQPVGSVALFDLPIRAVCSNFNARLQVSDAADSRFTCYLMNSLYWSGLTRQFVKQTTGIQNINADQLLAQHCLLPPTEDQRRIADFLDTETARIDRLVNAILESSSLLQAKRQSLLISTFPNQDGQTVRIGYYLKLVTSGPRGWGDFVGPTGTPFFRSANLRRDEIDPNLDDLAVVDPPLSAAAEAARSKVHINDVLIGITGANTGWISLADQRVVHANVSQHVCLVRPGTMVNGRWLAYALSSPQVQELLLGSQYGGAKTQLSLGDIRNLTVPLPTLPNQQKIAASITEGLSDITNERSLRNRQLALLAERRQALITAAVTGEITV